MATNGITHADIAEYRAFYKSEIEFHLEITKHVQSPSVKYKRHQLKNNLTGMEELG